MRGGGGSLSLEMEWGDGSLGLGGDRWMIGRGSEGGMEGGGSKAPPPSAEKEWASKILGLGPVMARGCEPDDASVE